MAHLKMKYYIEEIDYEISGLGVVEKLSNGDLYVPDIFLFEQTVTGTETQLKTNDIDKFYETFLTQATEAQTPEEKEKIFDDIGKIKLWWHSHVNMGVFWSATDVATQNSLDVDTDVENWWLSIVGNKRGERKAKLDIYKPHRLFMDDLDIVVGEDDTLRESIKKEIEEKVVKPAPIVYQNYKNVFGGGWGKNKWPKDYRSAPKPKTSDMQDMVDKIEENKEEYEVVESGIYVPKAGKGLKKSKNRAL